MAHASTDAGQQTQPPAGEARTLALVENLSDAVVLLDDQLCVRWATESLMRVLGHTAAPFIGTSVLDFAHPDDVDEHRDFFARVVTQLDVAHQTEGRVRHADGSYRWVETTATNRLTDPDVGNIVVTIRDSTDRRRAEAALRTSEERFRALVQNGSDVVTVADHEKVVTYVSPSVERVFGVDPEEFAVRAWDFVHPDDVDRLKQISQQLREGANGTSVKLEVRGKVRTGEWRWFELEAIELLDDPAVGGIVTTLRDVNDRKRAEQALRESEARYRQVAASSQRLSDIVQATSDLVVITDRSRRVIYMNAASRDFFGLGADESIDGFDFAPFSPRWVQRGFRDITLPALRDVGIWSGDFAYYRDGVEVPMSALFLAHRGPDGELEFVSSVTRDISDQKEYEANLQHQATHDPLTGLPNRTLLIDRLEVALARAGRTGRLVAVLFLDLDHFKVVNDSLGHTEGDRLLMSLASALRLVVRPGDTVGRFGGDEFVILCEDLVAAEDAHVIAERVRDALTGPIALGETEVFTSVSIGIAFAGVGVDPETLLRDADAAMYRAKDRGRSRWEVFDARMRTSARERLDVGSSLRRALERHELRVLYQPTVDLVDDRIVGVEALLRWEHPERGLLVPQEFIDIAEETGLIVPIGTWVIEQACRQAARWQATVPGHAPLRVGINLSGHQLEHPDLISTLQWALATAGIEADLLSVEITESVVMRDPEASIAALTALKALGVQVAVDDFGTGYSSLAYLRHFPVDVLKVDQAFVHGLGRDPQDSAIVAAVVSLAHTLGLQAIAEGVETTIQRDELRRIGCDMAQGYLISRPVPGDAIDRMLG